LAIDAVDKGLLRERGEIAFAAEVFMLDTFGLISTAFLSSTGGLERGVFSCFFSMDLIKFISTGTPFSSTPINFSGTARVKVRVRVEVMVKVRVRIRVRVKVRVTIRVRVRVRVRIRVRIGLLQ
jgi:hypothetical protein